MKHFDGVYILFQCATVVCCECKYPASDAIRGHHSPMLQELVDECNGRVFNRESADSYRLARLVQKAGLLTAVSLVMWEGTWPGS